MLIISRRQNEIVSLGNITLTIVKVNGEKVRIGVDAPADTKVLRAELAETDAPVALQFPTQKSTGTDIAKIPQSGLNAAERCQRAELPSILRCTALKHSCGSFR